jgi:hypothetical protein
MTLPASTLCAVAAIAATLLAGCSAVDTSATAPTTTTPAPRTTAEAPAPPAFHGEQARAARAVDELAGALRDGDVARLCRPGAVFTTAVVTAMNADSVSCEQDVESSSVVARPPTLSVAKLSFRPGLATMDVRVKGGTTLPLSVVRSGRRWLVSFSAGNLPLSAVARAMPPASSG